MLQSFYSILRHATIALLLISISIALSYLFKLSQLLFDSKNKLVRIKTSDLTDSVIAMWTFVQSITPVPPTMHDAPSPGGFPLEKVGDQSTTKNSVFST